MKKLLDILRDALLYLWQMPQNLIGLAYLALCTDRLRVTAQRGAVFYATRRVKGGVTFGRYVFVAVDNMTREALYDHEYGHVRQSRRWGWLWLPLFAIPSGLHCLFCRAGNYYHFYTERSANRLGGVPNYRGEYHHHADGWIVTCWDRLVEIKERYFNG